VPSSAPAAAAAVRIPAYDIIEDVQHAGPFALLRARRNSGERVLLKTPRSQYSARHDIAELRREFQILRTIDLPGVVHARSLVEWGSGNLAIEMDDVGISLAEQLAMAPGQPIPLGDFFNIAIQLARTLGELHERNIVHKNVVPQNVFISTSGNVQLADFGICSQLSRERQDSRLSARIEGSLPYISPEQTGRMSRDVDYRSDYYTLGVTFFELVTGRLPFSASDPLEWVHCHVGQTPPTAQSANRDVPDPLSRILSKLLSKSAEDRYQSSFGLIADLERCRDAYTATGHIESFTLGEADVSRSFQIPQQLYGREQDIGQLAELFDDVAHGGAGVCLVSGYAGVGKSALVNELGKAIVRSRGYLIEGKFEHFQQSTAYSALASAFRGLVEQLLGEPANRLAEWRDALQAALGSNAALLVALIPELIPIIGEQPPVPDLPPAEAQNRFQIVVLNFVHVFATAQHPLVIFLDDLQWSDVPSLNLLARLATTRDMAHLLLIGAYRDNAVDVSHPLTVTLDQIRRSREVVEITLAPLEIEAVDRLTADTLRTTVERSRPLARIVFDKTQGNPFFTKELLRSLHESGSIRFAPDMGRWEWDTAAVASATVADNVVDFMVSALRRLPQSTQQLLQLASCIGNTFDLRTLCIIAERDYASVGADLQAALKRQLIVPLTENYRFVGVAEPGAAPSPTGASVRYRFQHDRVHQAAYELIDPERKQAVHLSMGRVLLGNASAVELDERLLDIVAHLNIGRSLITDAEERRTLARLNRDAGLKAMRSSAYDAAMELLRVSLESLGPDAWRTDFDLMLDVARWVQQCAYLTGDYVAADAWTETVLAHATTRLARAEALSARTRQYATIGRMHESIQAALSGLGELGYAVKPEPTSADVERELANVTRNLGGRAIADLIDAPEITDPETRIALRLLMEVFAAAFLSGSGTLFPYLILSGVNLSLVNGSSSEAAFAYAAYGMLLCGELKDPALGYQYGRLGVDMNERFNDIALKSRIIYVYAMFVHHWSNHWASMTPWFLKAIEAGYQSGDMLYLAYSAQDCIIWDPTLDLATASREQRKYLAIVKDCEYQDSYDSGTLFLQMQLNFQGLTDGQFSMNNDSFDEQACVEGMRERGFMTGVANYHIYKAEIHALYGDFAGAMVHVEAQDRLVASAMSLPQLVRFCITAFLTRAALYSTMPGQDQPAVLTRLNADLAQMSAWAEGCRANFEHLRLTMIAELARLENRQADALAGYEHAAAAARESGFMRDEAVADELAARYLLALELPRAAEGYIRAARNLFDRWDARRKVEQMDNSYAAMVGRIADAIAGAESAIDSTSLDMSSVIKASQTISGEIVVDRLLRTTLDLLLENAGGNRGFFIVQNDDELVVRAQAEDTDDVPRLSLPLTLGASEELLVPLSIVNNVLRTGTPLVLDDATNAGRFASDPYLLAARPKSVMCVPIQRQRRFSGVIYIENNLTTGAFSQDRVEVIKLLAAQAGISMENARLYEEQVRLTEAQSRFVPAQFLEIMGRRDIADVGLGEFVARDMSVMFADLRAFTPLAEQLAPRQVIDLLNRHFSRIGGPIADAGGFIDSYNGDEIMALFPLPGLRAVSAGVSMQRALADFNRESIAGGGPSLEMGIGVNTGPLVLGTVGSQDRLKCGVVGDTVNTASRIEQLTKRYGAPFLIGEQTYRSLPASSGFSVRAVDRVAAKGKVQAMTLYEVLDAETDERRSAKESTRSMLDGAMTLYFARDFSGAGKTLAYAREMDVRDPVLAILGERCERYAITPPPDYWHGAESLDFK
jgi:predicted ATPase/class 3 adenylate cyclase